MSKPSPMRLQRVIALRDAALRILDASGRLIPGGPRFPGRIEAQYDGMSFLYMTPFQKRPQPPEPKTYIHALVRQQWSKPDLPYELDIWDSKKVLNVQWDDAGNVQLVSFRPGGWEKRLLAHHQTDGELALHPRCMEFLARDENR